MCVCAGVSPPPLPWARPTSRSPPPPSSPDAQHYTDTQQYRDTQEYRDTQPHPVQQTHPHVRPQQQQQQSQHPKPSTRHSTHAPQHHPSNQPSQQPMHTHPGYNSHQADTDYDGYVESVDYLPSTNRPQQQQQGASTRGVLDSAGVSDHVTQQGGGTRAGGRDGGLVGGTMQHGHGTGMGDGSIEDSGNREVTVGGAIPAAAAAARTPHVSLASTARHDTSASDAATAAERARVAVGYESLLADAATLQALAARMAQLQAEITQQPLASSAALRGLPPTATLTPTHTATTQAGVLLPHAAAHIAVRPSIAAASPHAHVTAALRDVGSKGRHSASPAAHIHSLHTHGHGIRPHAGSHVGSHASLHAGHHAHGGSVGYMSLHSGQSGQGSPYVTRTVQYPMRVPQPVEDSVQRAVWPPAAYEYSLHDTSNDNSRVDGATGTHAQAVVSARRPSPQRGAVASPIGTATAPHVHSSPQEELSLGALPRSPQTQGHSPAEPVATSRSPGRVSPQAQTQGHAVGAAAMSRSPGRVTQSPTIQPSVGTVATSGQTALDLQSQDVSEAHGYVDDSGLNEYTGVSHQLTLSESEPQGHHTSVGEQVLQLVSEGLAVYESIERVIPTTLYHSPRALPQPSSPPLHSVPQVERVKPTSLYSPSRAQPLTIQPGSPPLRSWPQQLPVSAGVVVGRVVASVQGPRHTDSVQGQEEGNVPLGLEDGKGGAGVFGARPVSPPVSTATPRAASPAASDSRAAPREPWRHWRVRVGRRGVRVHNTANTSTYHTSAPTSPVSNPVHTQWHTQQQPTPQPPSHHTLSLISGHARHTSLLDTVQIPTTANQPPNTHQQGPVCQQGVQSVGGMAPQGNSNAGPAQHVRSVPAGPTHTPRGDVSVCVSLGAGASGVLLRGSVDRGLVGRCVKRGRRGRGCASGAMPSSPVSHGAAAAAAWPVSDGATGPHTTAAAHTALPLRHVSSANTLTTAAPPMTVQQVRLLQTLVCVCVHVVSLCHLDGNEVTSAHTWPP